MRLSELKLNCPKCSYRTDASNMRKHIKVKHDEEAMATFNAALLAKKSELNRTEVKTCDLCGHQCASLSGLKSHKRVKHGNPERVVVVVDPATISVFGSDGENDGRSGEGTSEPPRKRFHGVTEGDLAMNRETAGGGGSSRRISCPVSDCDVAVSTRALFVEHLKSHDRRFELEKNVFDKEEDMRKWVADRCKKTTTSFIVNKTVATASGKTIYHNCQHEGFYERTGDVRYGHDTKKQTKEATCPAFLRVGQINAKRRKNGN
ncbi:hypothetical protein L5515_004042 [Caenorhabditis briggsae]|uniref:C2H2-type domain-containing protein n=1 Tax=Caenorhabditis briggsae TaxID=6238 RepID=A0AAE9EGG0_CAEBR|nr:hypothetical protein L5515_004042 [Caenorhabditis briggsae]